MFIERRMARRIAVGPQARYSAMRRPTNGRQFSEAEAANGSAGNLTLGGRTLKANRGNDDSAGHSNPSRPKKGFRDFCNCLVGFN
jgi:hypothetical protein